MTLTTAALVFAAACAASWWLTGRLRAYALAQEVIDHPNDRSSHSVATPRGGGMAIAGTVLVSLAAVALAGVLPGWEVGGIILAGAVVAAVGFADDHRPLPAAWRLLAHFVAAAIVLVALRSTPSLAPDGATPQWLGYGLSLILLVWLLNLTNFMDGIDGIAATEAITVCAGGVLLYLLVLAPHEQWLAPLLLAAASTGFLVWNWPPARIFMGDGGSGFVGLLLGVFTLQAGMVAPQLFWSWLILVGVFVVDASVTLARRLLRGEPIHQPHRTHAYQHAAQRLGRHLPVTLAVAAINTAWLTPLAVGVAVGWLPGGVGLAVAYLPLVALAIWMGSGMPRR